MSPDVFFNAAVNIVANNAAGIVMRNIISLMYRGGSTRSHLDDFSAEPNMRKAKSPSDQTAVVKKRAHLLRCRISSDIKILGMKVKQGVTHTAADQERLVAGFMQPVQHLQRALGYLVSGNGVSGARDDLGSIGLLGPAVIQLTTACVGILRPYNSSPRMAGAGKKPAFRSLRLAV